MTSLSHHSITGLTTNQGVPAMKSRTIRISHPLLALVALALVAGRAEAATSLTVNCTFTIAKDVTMVWTGAGALSGLSGTGNITWAIGNATLGTAYSTVGSGDGWAGADTSADTLKITNNSLTGDGLNLSLTAASTGWTAAATTGTVNQFVAACTANNTPPADTAAVLAAAGAIVTPTNASFATNIAATASSPSLWFAVKVPSSITTGGGAKTISFVFTGSAP
jgi:hypothetical protein